MATKFSLESNDPDLAGSWNKADIEEEMQDLEINDNWISYILSHYDFPATVVNALEDDNVLMMAFKFDGDVVYATKK